MGVSDEYVVNVIKREARMSEPVKDSVTSSGVDEQAVCVLSEDEAGVVALCGESVTCAEQGDVHDVSALQFISGSFRERG